MASPYFTSQDIFCAGMKHIFVYGNHEPIGTVEDKGLTQNPFSASCFIAKTTQRFSDFDKAAQWVIELHNTYVKQKQPKAA